MIIYHNLGDIRFWLSILFHPKTVLGKVQPLFRLLQIGIRCNLFDLIWLYKTSATILLISATLVLDVRLLSRGEVSLYMIEVHLSWMWWRRWGYLLICNTFFCCCWIYVTCNLTTELFHWSFCEWLLECSQYSNWGRSSMVINRMMGRWTNLSFRSYDTHKKTDVVTIIITQLDNGL